MSRPRSVEGVPIVVEFLTTLGTSNWFGTKMVAAAGVTTDKVLVAPVAFFLAAGHVYIGPTAVIGDHISFSVLDEEDALVQLYVANVFVYPGMDRKMHSGRTATIPAGYKLKYSYVSTGPNPVDVLVDYQWFAG